ncbi:hypothetical protein B0I35DRAFT_362019 [Stachybotrys elegans]|uniref:6-methylsalicylate decarboxylase n=1 Tax=Stachybotrys elegans TaxID=80388 RepID=A0A8K0SEK3_9HYPO|nr:hypothetical protein B0I35DRAFT_362019 [Stachybotrys elegans]
MLNLFILGCFLTTFAACDVKVDVHSHYLPDFYAAALRDAGHNPGPDGMPAIPAWDPETHLQFMQDLNITKSYLSISSPGVYISVPSRAATKNATRLARRVNDFASQLKAQYPSEFGFFASLPLPAIEESLQEIEYCFHELDPKPDGVVLMSNSYGMYFGDPNMDPIWEALDALNITIFEHPTGPCTEHNHLKYSNIDGETSTITPEEWRSLNRPVATRQRATPILDFPFDTARTFADLFYSEVPTRFPSLRWIIPHAGGGLLPTLDRIVTFSTLYPGFNMTMSLMMDTLSRSFYFDLAGPWPVDSSIPTLLRWVNHSNILWGSDVPFTAWAAASILAFDTGIEDVFGNSTRSQDVRSNNARRLLQ